MGQRASDGGGCGGVCLYVCLCACLALNGGAIIPHSLQRFPCFLRGQNMAPVPMMCLKAYLLVLMLSLSSRAWMCVRDTAQCQGGPWLAVSQACCRPDEILRKRLDFSDILSLLGI